jgi:hypothetical protein
MKPETEIESTITIQARPGCFVQKMFLAAHNDPGRLTVTELSNHKRWDLPEMGDLLRLGYEEIWFFKVLLCSAKSLERVDDLTFLITTTKLTEESEKKLYAMTHPAGAYSKNQKAPLLEVKVDDGIVPRKCAYGHIFMPVEADFPKNHHKNSTGLIPNRWKSWSYIESYDIYGNESLEQSTDYRNLYGRNPIKRHSPTPIMDKLIKFAKNPRKMNNYFAERAILRGRASPIGSFQL